MDIQTLLKDMRGKVEPYVAKGQVVAGISLSTLKQANGVVMDGMQTVIKSQMSAGKSILGAAQKSFEKVKADGIAAVVAAPSAYLPESRKYVFGACQNTFTAVNKTGGKVAEIVKKGYATAAAKVAGKPERATAGRKRSTRKAAPKTAAARKPKSPAARNAAPKSGNGGAAPPATDAQG